jgi:hypothetical protein
MRPVDHGVTQWARENPGEAAVAGTAYGVRMMTSNNHLRDTALNQTNSLLQSTQFNG